MRRKPPRRASLDEVKITREGGMAIIEHADPAVSRAQVNIGPQLETMPDADVLDLFNAMMDAQGRIAAEFDSTAVEIPPGKPQIRFVEYSGQLVPRGQVLRCHIEEDEEDNEVVIYVDERKFRLAEFAALLRYYAGWGMRITFVPEDEVTEQPEIDVREPEDGPD